MSASGVLAVESTVAGVRVGADTGVPEVGALVVGAAVGLAVLGPYRLLGEIEVLLYGVDRPPRTLAAAATSPGI